MNWNEYLQTDARRIPGVAQRRPVSMAALVLTVAVAMTCGAGAQLVKAPRYQGSTPVDEPLPQLNLPPLPPAKTPNGTVVEDVVARVNDQIISRSDVQRAEQALEQDAAAKNMSPAEVAQAQKNMLRDMIDQQLMLSKAKELGLNADAEVIRQLDEIRKANKLDSMEDLEKAARQQGVSFEDFKAHIRDQILTQEVVRDEVGRHLQMTQADENKYYQEHLKDFEQPEQIRLSEILVPLPENATAAEVTQAERKAKVIKEELNKGTDFAELAKKNSGGPTAAQGGELGLFKRGALAKVLEDQTFGLVPGQSTEPIRTRQGYVILKVTEHDQAGPAALKSVEPQVQEAMYMQEMQPALRAYLTKLREQAYVDIQPGFVDSGASANETKPVFTAYAPPAVKKKKAREKARFEGRGRYTTVSAAAKKAVVASPDTTGTRTITGPEATPLIDPKTGLATMVTERPGKKPKKVKREKVRFGQAPRNVLPPVAEEADGGSTAAPSGQGAAAGSQVAANNAGTPNGAAESLDANPLDPVAPERKKTRFAARASEHKEKKQEALTAKEREKALATPEPMSSEEKATKQTQAAPLGLAGDTSRKKPKRVKRAKGTPKQRLENRKKVVPEAPPPVAPTVNPALAPTAETGTGLPGNARPAPSSPPNSPGPKPIPSQPDTTLPPANPTAPGAPPSI